MAARWNGVAALVLALLTFGALVAPLCQAAAGAAVDEDAESLTAELRKARPPRQRTRAVKIPPPPPKSTSSGPTVATAKPPPPPNEITIEGGLSVIFLEMGNPLFVLDLGDGDRIPILINQTDAEKYLGYKIRVRLAPNDLSALAENKPVPVQGIQVIGTLQSRSQQKEGVAPGGGSKILKAVVFLVSTCGYPAAITPSALRSLFFNGPSTSSDAVTMQNAYKYCSQGIVAMNSSTVEIIEVKLPCTGNITSVLFRTFNFTEAKSSCSILAYQDMLRLASNYYVNNVLGQNLAKDQPLRVLVIPRELAVYCEWLGFGLTGAASSSEAYVNGVYANDLYAYMRQLGYSYFSLPRAVGGLYGYDDDPSSIMGRGRYCFNAPNLWRLGWVSPVPGGDFNGTTLTVGQPRTFYLPGQNTNRQSYVRINPTWAITGREIYNNKTQMPIPVFFIAHRYQESVFDTFSPPTSSIYVYSYKGSQDGQSLDQSYRVATLTSTSRVYRGPYGLVVRFTSSVTSWFGGNATVVICRASGETENTDAESCSDGLDNDCDGRVDSADPDCANTPRASPPPPSPRPSKQPSPSPPRRQPSPGSSKATSTSG
ncbi:hypothetical protein Vretimale_9141 [Volvox reticuliferus]|uniref:Peptidase M11 gametolysin domain-containing protein n=1 Tax=Volvox reticuliferus TaxID=1737510 RepID=A0A8J4LNG2_9CHLO|nr:hypothetical protein Vretimale_9141 [Volvox reticuliferus]